LNPYGVLVRGGSLPGFHPGLFMFNPFGIGGKDRFWQWFSAPGFHPGLFVFNPFGIGGSSPILSDAEVSGVIKNKSSASCKIWKIPGESRRDRIVV